MEYTFAISGYDTARLLSQVSRALETRTQMLSRQKYPGMWKMTDGLNRSAGARQGNGRRKFFSVLCLALGIFLFVPGLMKPQELQGPLFVGAVAIGAGIGGLCRGRKKKDPFEKAARQLLAGRDETDGSARVVFSDAGMCICGGGEETVPYSDFEFFIEGEDVYLITFAGRVVLLQKKDLQQGAEEFSAFIAEHTAITKSI